MAEAIVNHSLPHHWQAFSAGTNPGLHISEGARLALDEIGIPNTGSMSQHFSEYAGTPFDLVITLSESAREQCFSWSGQEKRMHIALPDPAVVRGSNAEIMAAYRAVRDRIQREILPLLRAET